MSGYTYLNNLNQMCKLFFFFYFLKVCRSQCYKVLLGLSYHQNVLGYPQSEFLSTQLLFLGDSANKEHCLFKLIQVLSKVLFQYSVLIHVHITFGVTGGRV